jgi:hypothetical protein
MSHHDHHNQPRGRNQYGITDEDMKELREAHRLKLNGPSTEGGQVTEAAPHPSEPVLISTNEELAGLLRRHGAEVTAYPPAALINWPGRANINVTEGKLLVGERLMVGEVYIPPVQNFQVVEPVKVSNVRVINPEV